MKRVYIRVEYTFKETYDSFLLFKKSKGLSHSTIDTYRSDFTTFSRYIDPEMPISQLTKKQIQEAVSRISDRNVSRNTVRHYTATLKSYLSWCRDEGLCDIEIPLFKGEEGVPRLYTEEELKLLLKRPNLRSCSFGEYRAWVIVNLLVNNGCRASTIRAIQNRDVYLDDGIILLRHMKARKAITIPLCDELIEILRSYMKIRKGKAEDYLFCDVEGNQMSDNCLRNAIRAYNRSRGVSLTGIHAFRHTFARMYLINCQGDALKLQKLLGHETLDMTKHYIKLFDADIRNEFRERSPLTILIKKERISMPTKNVRSPGRQ